jgi:hypothetical protein
MTEYEIADLAASNFSNLIEMVSVIQVQAISITDGILQFMTILFSYIAAAYFVGASLNRGQAWILTSLYLFWQLWTIGVTLARGAMLTALHSSIHGHCVNAGSIGGELILHVEFTAT